MAISESLQETIHFEYISTDISIRQLAAKYDLSKSMLERLIKKGGWTAEKNRLMDVAQARAKKRIEEAERKAEIEERQRTETARQEFETRLDEHMDALTGRAERVYSATDKLLALVDSMLENADAMAPRDLQAMSSTLMNIKQLHDIRPAEETSKSVIIRLEGALDDWAG